MSQHQIGTLALTAFFLLVAAGGGVSAIRGQIAFMSERFQRRPLGRLLTGMAALGLACGSITHGMYEYGAPLPHSDVMIQIAFYSLVLAVIGFGPMAVVSLVDELTGR